jgi:hypothetical protein
MFRTDIETHCSDLSVSDNQSAQMDIQLLALPGSRRHLRHRLRLRRRHTQDRKLLKPFLDNGCALTHHPWVDRTFARLPPSTARVCTGGAQNAIATAEVQHHSTEVTAR